MAALEDGEMMRSGQLAIEVPHFEIIEILRARGAEQRERHGLARLGIGIPGAGRDHPGDVRQPSATPKATREPPDIPAV